MRKQRRKPIIYCFIHYFVEDKKPPKPNEKNEEENQILIKNRDKIIGSKV